MAWTQTDVDAIKAAIAKAERRVTYGDKTVEYRDMSEMMRALKMIEAEVASLTTKTTPSRSVLVQHGRGI
jgi:biopolymer transport protein ExbD